MTKVAVVRQLEGEVLVLLRRARRATADRARSIHPDLAAAGYLVLAHLDEHPAGSQAQLAEALGMDKGAVSRQVQVLGDLGLVEKSEDPDDRRACIVSLTADGSARMTALAAERRTAYVERFQDWTEDELSLLVGQLGRYNRTLER